MIYSRFIPNQFETVQVYLLKITKRRLKKFYSFFSIHFCIHDRRSCEIHSVHQIMETCIDFLTVVVNIKLRKDPQSNGDIFLSTIHV